MCICLEAVKVCALQDCLALHLEAKHVARSAGAERP